MKSYKIKMEVIKTIVEQVEITVQHSDKQLAREFALRLVGVGDYTNPNYPIPSEQKRNQMWENLGRNEDLNGNSNYTKHPFPQVVRRSHNNKIATHDTEPKIVSTEKVIKA